METYHVGIGIAGILEVIVQTILSEEQHGVDEGTHILVAFVAVGVLALHLSNPSCGTASGGPAFEELDAGIDVGTILMGAVHCHSGHVENSVVPTSEHLGVVPSGVGVIVPVARGISTLDFTYTDRNVHPEEAVVLGFLVDVLGLVDHCAAGTYVRAYERHVHHVEASSLKLSLCGDLASVLLGSVEEFDEFLTVLREVVDIGGCGGRHLCECAHGKHGRRYGK